MTTGMLPVADTAAVRRQARRILRAERRPAAGVIALQGITTVAGLAGPAILGRILDHAGKGGRLSYVDIAGAVFLGALLFQSLLTGFTRRRAAVLGEKVLAELREDFVESVLALPLGVVERAGTGDLLTRSSTDVDQLSDSVRRAAPEIGIAFVQTVLIVAAIVYAAPLLGLVLVPIVPVLLLSTRWYLHRATPAYRAEAAALSRVNAMIQETVTAGRTVEAFRLGGRRFEETEEAVSAWVARSMFTLRLRCVYFPIVEVAYVVPLVLAVLVGGLLHDHSVLSIGSVTAAALYTQLLVEPLDALLGWMDVLQLGGASLARLLGVAEVEPPAATDEVPRDETVVASGLHYAYRDGRDVLHGIDLRLEPGDRVAVVGPSGAGKSTLALLLTGIHEPRLGSVRIGGVDAHALPTLRLREEIALVTQEHHVFAGTLRQNLALVAPDAEDAVLLRALATVDAAEWVAQLPAGLDTELGASGTALTSAQAQQLALARLILADPHTIVLDEATSLLDPRAARHLERSLGRLLQGRTVVAVAHRLQTAHDADRIAVVEGGRIVEQGAHHELLAAGGTYAALWRSWQGEDDR